MTASPYIAQAIMLMKLYKNLTHRLSFYINTRENMRKNIFSSVLVKYTVNVGNKFVEKDNKIADTE